MATNSKGLTDAIRSAMADGTARTSHAISEATGWPLTSIATTMSRLVRQGEMDRVGIGVYQAGNQEPPPKRKRGKGKKTSLAQRVVATAVQNGDAPIVVAPVTITLSARQAARLIEWLMKEAL